MMSDCEKCWETPCVCGWDYRDMSRDRRLSIAAAALGMTTAGLVRKLGADCLPDKHPHQQLGDFMQLVSSLLDQA
jgi:hypothetical protein